MLHCIELHKDLMTQSTFIAVNPEQGIQNSEYTRADDAAALWSLNFSQKKMKLMILRVKMQQCQFLILRTT